MIYASLTGFSALFIGIGIGRFCYPPLIPTLIKQAWFSAPEAFYLEAANLTGYLLGAALAWKISRKVPTIRLIRYALLLAVLTFLGCAYPASFMVYALFRLLEGFAGGLIMVLTPSTIFNHISASQKSVASGIIFSGIGLGIVLIGAFTPVLISSGLRTTWYFYAVLSIVLLLVFYKGWPQTVQKRPVRSADILPPKKVNMTQPLLLTMLVYVCNIIGFAPFTVFWVDYITRDLHLGIQAGNTMWLLWGLGASIGPLVSGPIAARAGISRSLRVCLILDGFSLMLPVFSTAYPALIWASLVTGAAGMITTALVAARVPELVEKENQKRVWGWMTILASFFYALSAYLFSFLFSVTHSYDLIFAIGGVILIGGGLTDILVSLRRKYAVTWRHRGCEAM
jgi:predicted MFS family arabinose efflux permease